MDVPFIERQERVMSRQDRLVEKDTLVKRDQRFRLALKKAKRSGKQIDIKIKNTGTIEELQLVADEIFERVVLGKKHGEPKETMSEKHGGYTVLTPNREERVSSTINQNKEISK